MLTAFQVTHTFICRIIVLISDGQADSNSNPIQIARTLKNEGVIIFGVGVASINREELEQVASSSRHLYMLRDFRYIENVTADLRDGMLLFCYIPSQYINRVILRYVFFLFLASNFPQHERTHDAEHAEV